VIDDRPARASSQPEGEDRGQVAVGTLVIFIALTLIAVATTAVLFDTAGFLESWAADTGEGTSEQVTDRLDVVANTGENITDGEINQVDVVVANSPGGSPIDLRNVTVQWAGPEVGTTLVHEDAALAGQDTFSAVSYTDIDGTFPVLSSTDDRYALRFEPGVVFGESGLAEGDRVDLTLVTPAGTTLPVRIAVPQSLAGKESVEL